MKLLTMAKKNFWTGMLAIVLVFGMAVISCGPNREFDPNTRNISQRNLVGIWELEDAYDVPISQLSNRIEFFRGGTGVVDGTGITWQLLPGNRLQITMGGFSQVTDIELSENRRLLTFHYDGFEYYSRLGMYRRR